MNRLRKIAHQWLTTDAAMGAAEVPIARRMAAAPSGRAVAPKTHSVAAPTTVQFRQSVPRHQSTTPVPAPPVAMPPKVAPPPLPRIISPPSVTALPPIPAGNIVDEPKLAGSEKIGRLAVLTEEASQAMAAYLSDVATRMVFGEGDPAAMLMFIGEGPGMEEDRTGRPFVGRSGQLLDKMIVAMGFTRETVYIANICKLRAASWDDEAGRMKDRPPNPVEAALGLPWLHRQIAIIQPRVIVTLGASAIRYLVGVTENMGMVRGHWHQYRGVPVMPTYHPSYLLRAYSPENRAKVWSDLQAAIKQLKVSTENAA